MWQNENAASGTEEEQSFEGSGAEGGSTPDEVVKTLREDQVQKEDFEKKEEIDEALKELNESDNETEKTIRAADQAFRVSEALESLHESLRSFKGTPSNSDRKMINIAMESFVQKYGLQKDYSVAMESVDPITDDFLGSVAKFVWDKIVKLWKIIIEMIKHMVVSFFDLMAKVFALSRIVNRRAKKLLDKSKQVKGVIYSETIEAVDILPAIHKDGQPPEFPVEDLLYLFYMSEGVFGEVNRWTSDMGEEIANWLNTVNVANATVPPIMPSVKIPYGETREVTNPKEEIGGKVPYTRVISTDILLGGRKMYTRMLDTKMELPLDQAAAVYPWLGSFIEHEQKDVTNVTKIRTLTRQECGAMAQHILNTTFNILGFQNYSKRNDQIRKNILAGAKRVEAELAELKDTQNRKAIDFAKNVALSAPRIVEQPASQFSTYYLHMATKMLDYIEASLDVHG